MTRREIREVIFKILFRADFHDKETMEEQEALFFECLQEAGIENEELFFERLKDAKIGSEDICYMKTKVNSLLEHLEEIDQILNDVAKGWKTTRMGKVDLTLLRLAVYEIRYEEEIPTGVAINEAVELAKKYGTDESSSFVNGVLAKIA